MKRYKNICLVWLLCLPLNVLAQVLAPVTHFHSHNSQYTYYDNNFLSGFMQNGHQQAVSDGFLQLPFVGDPLLVYVGEKDSTQFMAYASGYTLEQLSPTTYRANYTRYNVLAELQCMPAYCVQKYTYPDTLADKGFLLDIDNAASGAQNEDMEVVFVDKRTIRAYKRSEQKLAHVPELFYVAHFSHPFSKWNVRREVVRLENGQREQRCKAAFVFDLPKGEALTVTSAVSALSTDDAFAQLHISGNKRHFNDQRKSSTPQSETNNRLLAQNKVHTRNLPSRNKATRPTTMGQKGTKPTPQQPLPQQPQPISQRLTAAYSPAKWLEISTRNAELQAAFTAAIKQLQQQLPKAKMAPDALAFIDAITPLYLQCENKESNDIELTDSLLRHHAQSLFAGQSMTNAQAAWFVLNALGFVPNQAPSTAQAFRLVRPLFNVLTLHLPRTRRLILHTKNNTPRNLHMKQATLMHQPLGADFTFTREQLVKGGILEVKMMR